MQVDNTKWMHIGSAVSICPMRSPERAGWMCKPYDWCIPPTELSDISSLSSLRMTAAHYNRLWYPAIVKRQFDSFHCLGKSSHGIDRWREIQIEILFQSQISGGHPLHRNSWAPWKKNFSSEISGNPTYFFLPWHLVAFRLDFLHVSTIIHHSY